MKSNLDKYFKADNEVVKTGVWMNISDDVGFLVKPFDRSNPSVKTAFAVHFKPHARQIELGTLDDKKELEIMVKLFVSACLVDWKGIEIDGKETPFSKEIAIKFLTGLPKLFHTLMDYAEDFKNFKEVDEDEGEIEEVGNS